MSTVAWRVRRLSRSQAAELQRAYRCDGDLAARERLIEAYLPLVKSLALRYAHCGERVEDLVQVGSIGLIKAVDRFEPERGVDLAVFATPNIVGEIRRHLRDRSSPIRIPRRQQEVSAKVVRARHELNARLQRNPTHAEVAQAADLNEREVAAADEVEHARAPRPLVEAVPAAGAEDGFRASEARAAVATGMRTLRRREQLALRCRYYGDMSQAEIADHLGVSSSQASRLISSGLAKLRANLEGNLGSSAVRQLNSGHGDSRRRPGRAA